MSTMKSTFLICLLGFVLACRAAPSSNQTPTPPASNNLGAGDAPGGPDGAPGATPQTSDDGDNQDDYNENNDYYGDNEDDKDEEESAEESLSELAEEHYEVNADCHYMKQMINNAKQANSTAQIDPDLQQAYTQCTQYLSQLEQQIQQISATIASGKNDDN